MNFIGREKEMARLERLILERKGGFAAIWWRSVLHLPLNTERLGKLTEDSFVDNSELKKLLGWKKMPIAAEDGMRETLGSFSR